MEGRSCDNDGEQGGGGGETILVRGVKSGYKRCDENGRPYWWVEFYKVDLKGGEVEKNCCPKMLTCMGEGAMVGAGTKVYIIGGLTLGMDYQGLAAYKPPSCPEDQPFKDVVDYYTCASVLDTKEGSWCWKQVPLPIKNRTIPRCASLDGKIYHFGHPRLYPEFFDASVGLWNFMRFPPELADCRVSEGVLPDPNNNRILVNLFGGQAISSGGHLYAYYPSDHTMKLVGDRVAPWSNAVALADDVAYVHVHESSRLLYAFDLSNGGKSLDVVWTSTSLPDVVNGVSYDVKLTLFEFDALFHVGNGKFWFAVWSPAGDGTRVFFVKFKINPTGSGDKIICTPLALQSHLLESTAQVYDFLMLEEACG